MKFTTTLATLLLAAAAATFAPAFAQICATVEVDNVRPQQGLLMVAAYGSAETFGKTPLAQLRLPAGDAKMKFELCGLSGSEVALMLFQDLDSDGQMGRNLVGMPTEPWGASGSRRRPPSGTASRRHCPAACPASGRGSPRTA